jgi:two-component system chemotaxis response regulator CheB
MPANRDIVILGASSGGLDALQELLPRLPHDLPAAIFVVMHMPASPPSILHAILQRSSTWPVMPAVDGTAIRHGVITVAVSDHHLLFADGAIRLTRGPRENRSRPAIDATMRSAAIEFRSRTIGVVLTGNLDDGTAGLWAVKDRGGVALAQLPQDAEYPSMPRSAIANSPVDEIVTLAELPAALTRLTAEAAPPWSRSGTDALNIENRIALGQNAMEAGVLGLGPPSMNTCPHCHGTLMEINDAGRSRFRCHTGHSFTPASLLVDLDETIDEGLWGVLRSIDERQLLLDQLIQTAKLAGDEEAAQEYARQSEDARLRGNEIRGLVMSPLPENAARHRA